MALLTSHEVTDIRSDVVETLFDTCVVQTPSVSYDSGGQPVTTYSDSSATACGFAFSGASEPLSQFGVEERAEAEVRLAVGTTVTYKSRIKLTHVKGVALGTALVFEAMGEPQVRLMTLVLQVRRVV